MATEELGARPAGGGGSRAILFIGLALGAIAAVLIAVILSSSDDDAGGGTANTLGVPSTRLAVAAVDPIPARTRLTRDMLEVRTYQVGDVDADAFTSVTQVLNRVTAVDIAAGEVIVPTTVSVTAGEGLSFSVSAGMRAISINVNEVVIAGGNLSPGNFVDIIGLFEIAEGGDVSSVIEQFTGQPFQQGLIVPNDANLTFTILQNIKVLAVAQDLPPEAAAPSGDDADDRAAFLKSSEANPRAGTVTLELTPQQAQVMATADQLGTLRLSLRPFGDEEEADVIPIIVVLD